MKKLLQLISEFRKVTGQKMSEVFPYTSNEQLQNEIKIISFTVAPNMTYLGIIFIKIYAKATH